MQEQATSQGAGQDLHVQPAPYESEAQFRRLLERLPAGAYTCDREGLITYFNQHALRLWGRAPKLNDPVDRFCGSFRLFAPDGTPIPHDQCWMALSLKTGEEYNGREIVLERPDGRRLTVLAHANPVHDASGELLGAVNVLVDISERKRLEERNAALLARERAARLEAEKTSRRVRFLAEASRVLNSSLDYETTLESVAKLAVPAMADWCAVDFLVQGGSLQRVALVHGDPHRLASVRVLQQRYPSRPGTPYGIMRVFETGQPELYVDISDAMLEQVACDAEELAELRKLGLKSALVVPLVTRANLIGAVSMVYAESDRRYEAADLAVAEELARRAAVAIDNAWLYHQAQALNEELEAKVASRTEGLAQANRELESFAFAVSHDLRSPLSAIRGFSQALVEDYAGELKGEAQHYLARIQSNAERMGELIDDILMLSRVSRQELRLAPVDLCMIFAAVAQSLQDGEPERRVILGCTTQQLVVGDSGLLRIVLENLVGNAWKFTGRREQTVITFGARQDARGVVYYLEDNGVGFDLKYASQLFQPFQRLHDARDYPGVGIGLATVKRIVERHGGSIWVESAVDQGTTVFFTLQAG